ncbi:MAG: hypothetical protein GYB31_03120 [Bacteroidetes bacterium]|nr:hypothetical protein [Bacteroidota bacterium]
MKTKFTLIALMGCLSLFAQSEQSTNILGGSLGFNVQAGGAPGSYAVYTSSGFFLDQTNSKRFSASFSPYYLKRKSEKWAIGGGLNFFVYQNRYELQGVMPVENKITGQQYGLSGMARRYFPISSSLSFILQPELRAAYRQIKSFSEDALKDEEAYLDGILRIQPGVDWGLSEKLHFLLRAGSFYGATAIDLMDGNQPSFYLNGNFTLSSLIVGLEYHW